MPLASSSSVAVRAIKEAGRWDNITERNKMIRKYAEYDRMNTNKG